MLALMITLAFKLEQELNHGLSHLTAEHALLNDDH